MKILSCKIENFGKLSNQEFRFTAGKNVIFQDNGYGKSTLAAFIRALFYGLDGTKTRDDVKNEAKRYAPWQGGVFGGRLVFETSGKTYQITRTFDKKGNTEFFECRDANTNLVTNDFSEEIGEELFAINRESFSRSVFIGQDDLATAATDVIHGKIGGNENHSQDLSLFDLADNFLKTRLDKITPNRVTGLASGEKKEMEELKRSLSNKSFVEANYRAQEEMREQKREELIHIHEEKDSLQLLQRQKSEEKAKNEIRKMLQEKKEKLEEQEKQQEKLISSFGLFVPDIETINQNIEKATVLLQVQTQGKENAFSTEDMTKMDAFHNQFAGGIPSEEECASYEQIAIDLSQKQNEYQEKRMTDNEKRSYASLSQQIEKKQKEQVQLEKKKQQGKKIQILSIPFFVLAAAATGAGFLLLKNPILGIAVGGVLALLGVLFLILGGQQKRTDVSGLQEELQQMMQDFELLKQKETDFDESVAMQQILSTRNSLNSFLQRYHIVNDNEVFLDDLHLLREDINQYLLLQKKEKLHEEAVLKQQQLIQELDAFYISMGQQVNQVLDLSIYRKTLGVLLEKRIRLDQVMEATTQMREEYAQYVAAHPVETEDTMVSFEESSSLTLEEVNQLIDQNREKENQCYERMHELENSLDMMLENLEELNEKEEQLQSVTAAYLGHLQQFQDGTKAREFLAKAKDALTNRFSTPIYEAFCQYFSLLTKNAGIILSDDFAIDAHADVSFLSAGTQRQVTSLSKGYQDLVHLCLRFAYIDAMYPNEKPVVFLDDPFTNFDTEKVKQGLAFLDEISEKYQVLYFTCHESRA